MNDQTEDIRHRLNAETATAQWIELEKHFARGVAIRVASDQNLLDVAVAFTQDNQMLVKGWLNSNAVAAVSIEEAKDWGTRDPDLWVVVVAPWILIQERSEKS